MSKLRKEVIELKVLDKTLSGIINKNLPELESRGSVYESLLRAIISQQISTSAAKSIREKFLNEFKGVFPEPKKLLKVKEEKFRTLGLSRQKVAYMKNVAEHFITENLHEKDFSKMSDEEIIDDLTKIKGVGEWTAEMILIFTLNRPDVFSYKDLALVTPIFKLYKINPKKYSPKKLKEKVLKITQKWSPYRSLACRYLWEYSDSVKKEKSKQK